MENCSLEDCFGPGSGAALWFEMRGCRASISCTAETDGIDVGIKAVKTTCFMYDGGFFGKGRVAGLAYA